MAIPLFNSIASWLLKKRFHQIELFLKYPGEVQQEVLQQLLDLRTDQVQFVQQSAARKLEIGHNQAESIFDSRVLEERIDGTPVLW